MCHDNSCVECLVKEIKINRYGEISGSHEIRRLRRRDIGNGHSIRFSERKTVRPEEKVDANTSNVNDYLPIAHL